MNRPITSIFFVAASFAAGNTSLICYGATYGNTTPFNFLSATRPNFVIGSQVSIPEELQLDSFGLIYGPPEPGILFSSNAIFGLYDSAGGLGTPGSLVATTAIVNVNSHTTYTFDFNSHPRVAPGMYWMMALYESFASPRAGGIADRSYAYAYFSQPFASGTPSETPLSMTAFRGRFNYWINGTPVPEPNPICSLVMSGLIWSIWPRSIKLLR